MRQHWSEMERKKRDIGKEWRRENYERIRGKKWMDLGLQKDGREEWRNK